MVSLGCPKALVDSERILTRLRADGYAMSPDYAGADVVLVNTCGFLDSAKAESLEAIGSAMAENGSVVALRSPGQMGMAGFISQVENLPVRVDAPAKVIIDEVNGVIVMGDAVRISTVAIAQGNLTVSVQETPQVIQPAPFSQGQTAVVLGQGCVRIGGVDGGRDALGCGEIGVAQRQAHDGHG